MRPMRELWRSPLAKMRIDYEQVHVWRAFLDLPAWQAQKLWALLSENERQRARRFRFQTDRERYAAAHGWLRIVLGRYLDVEASQVRFRNSSLGKPFLDSESGDTMLRFNLSHSRDLALYAVTWGREVGIDLEYMHPDLADESIARRFFSPEEVRALAALPAGERKDAFFACWTRKEAYIKARGQGLSLPLDRFDVSLTPGAPARLLGTEGDPQEACRWSLRALEAAPGYAAALAVEGHVWRIRYWHCSSLKIDGFTEKGRKE